MLSRLGRCARMHRAPVQSPHCTPAESDRAIRSSGTLRRSTVGCPEKKLLLGAFDVDFQHVDAGDAHLFHGSLNRKRPDPGARCSTRPSRMRGYGGSPIPVESLDRAMWRFLKGKRHLTASVLLYTNWRTAIFAGLLEICCAPWPRSTHFWPSAGIRSLFCR